MWVCADLECTECRVLFLKIWVCVLSWCTARDVFLFEKCECMQGVCEPCKEYVNPQSLQCEDCFGLVSAFWRFFVCLVGKNDTY